MITHPEKVLFPADGITKGALAAYYEAVAPVMLPHIRGRPVTMERYPAGIGQPGFMHKDVSRGFPDWLARVAVPKKGGTVHHPLVTDTRSLLWLANQNTITAPSGPRARHTSFSRISASSTSTPQPTSPPSCARRSWRCAISSASSACPAG